MVATSLASENESAAAVQNAPEGTEGEALPRQSRSRSRQRDNVSQDDKGSSMVATSLASENESRAAVQKAPEGTEGEALQRDNVSQDDKGSSMVATSLASENESRAAVQNAPEGQRDVDVDDQLTESANQSSEPVDDLQEVRRLRENRLLRTARDVRDPPLAGVPFAGVPADVRDVQDVPEVS